LKNYSDKYEKDGGNDVKRRSRWRKEQESLIIRLHRNSRNRNHENEIADLKEKKTRKIGDGTGSYKESADGWEEQKRQPGEIKGGRRKLQTGRM